MFSNYVDFKRRAMDIAKTCEVPQVGVASSSHATTDSSDALKTWRNLLENVINSVEGIFCRVVSTNLYTPEFLIYFLALLHSRLACQSREFSCVTYWNRLCSDVAKSIEAVDQPITRPRALSYSGHLSTSGSPQRPLAKAAESSSPRRPLAQGFEGDTGNHDASSSGLASDAYARLLMALDRLTKLNQKISPPSFSPSASPVSSPAFSSPTFSIASSGIGASPFAVSISPPTTPLTSRRETFSSGLDLSTPTSSPLSIGNVSIASSSFSSTASFLSASPANSGIQSNPFDFYRTPPSTPQKLAKEASLSAVCFSTPTSSPRRIRSTPPPQRLEQKLFIGKQALFQLDLLQLDLLTLGDIDISLLEKLGTYFTIHNQAPLLATINDSISDLKRKRKDNNNLSDLPLIKWIKLVTNEFRGGNESYHEADCIKILHILCNISANPCLYMFSVFRAILARHYVYLLKIMPRVKKMMEMPGSSIKEHYFSVRPLGERKILIIFSVAVTDLLCEHSHRLTQVNDEGNDFPLLVMFNVEINLANNVIQPGACTLQSNDPALMKILENIHTFDLLQPACEREDSDPSSEQYTFLDAVHDKIYGCDNNWKAHDSLSADHLLDLPAETLLPEYTRSLYDFSLTQYRSNSGLAAKINGVVNKDTSRAIFVEGLNADQILQYHKQQGLRDAGEPQYWLHVERYLYKTLNIPLDMINAMKIQLAQGMVNPGQALWTELITKQLAEYHGVCLQPYKALNGKPIHFRKNAYGQWTYTVEYLIYGIMSTKRGSTPIFKVFNFPLFTFCVVINLPSESANPPVKWVGSAYMLISSFGQKILNEMKISTVFTDLITKYSSYGKVQDIALCNEILVWRNKHTLSDGRTFLVRNIKAVCDRKNSRRTDNNVALFHLILGENYFASERKPESIKEMLEKLIPHVGNPAIKWALILDWAREIPSKFELGGFSNEQIKEYLQEKIKRVASISNIGIDHFYLIAAFALMQGKLLHYFDEMPPDETHPKIWIKHRLSFQLTQAVQDDMLTQSLTPPIKDVFILHGKDNAQYFRLEGDIIPAPETGVAVPIAPSIRK